MKFQNLNIKDFKYIFIPGYYGVNKEILSNIEMILKGAPFFLEKLDIYYLAKQFYRHIYRNPELEEESEWQEIKRLAENFLVEHRMILDEETKSTPEDYREFLRFYTGLEVKYEDPTEFIFDEYEKNIFLKFITLQQKRYE